MILPRQQDAVHRGQLYRLLIALGDNDVLSKQLVFKDGTCAAMQGYLDRFSVDLDFDLVIGASKESVHQQLVEIFQDLRLEISDCSKTTILYVLKYDSQKGMRNTLHFDAVDFCLPIDAHKPTYLVDIDRFLLCQSIETMFSHKLVALYDRYQKHKAIAGRDIYDIYSFFLQQHRYDPVIIQHRTGKTVKQYFEFLVNFIQKNVSQTMLDEDLNVLLPSERFAVIRRSLKAEVIAMLSSQTLP